MTIEGKRKSATFCLAVILFVLSLFAPTTESFRLKKTERRDRRREAAEAFQPGRILFGNVFEKRSSVDAQARDGAHISTASSAEAGEDANYQGDSPACALSDLQTQVPPEMKHMHPSVLCGLDKMKFMLQGADVHQFAMDPGPAASPVPLSNIPATCGYSVQRNPPSLLMMAPYNDCFMIQEGAYYVLPMRWQDTQFSLWCPMRSVSQPTAPPMPSPPQMPQFQPQYFLPPWILPPGIPPPAQKTQSPPGQQPQFPQMPPGQQPQFPQMPPGQQPQFPQMPPGQQPQFPQMPPGQQPQSPQMPPGRQPQSPQMPPGQQPQSPQMPPGQQPQSPQIPPGQQPQSPQIPQFPQMSFPIVPSWNPYPFTAPPAKVPSMTSLQTASKTGSQQLFDPNFYPVPLSLYPPSLPWGGLLYPPVADPPVKSKANQQPAFGYYPYNFPPIFNPFPQPQQPPPKVLPYFPPFGQLPIKVFRYPAT